MAEAAQRGGRDKAAAGQNAKPNLAISALVLVVALMALAMAGLLALAVLTR